MAKENLEDKPNHSIAVWKALEGRWGGQKRLWLSRDEPEEKSEARAGIQISEDNRQVELDYSWLYDDRRQSAVLTALLRGNGKAECRWSDTFHTSGQPMKLKGKVDEKGFVSVRGAYAVERGAEWGWRIDLDPASAKLMRIVMYNVSPEGKEELAVEAIFRR